MARAIAASELPVVSAVGHEVDFSIADMVADHRAATPSAAAELISPDPHEWLQRLQAAERSLGLLIRRQLTTAATRVNHLRQRLKHPGAQLREQAQRLDDLEQRLLLAQKNILQRLGNRHELLVSRLMARSPLPGLRQLQRETQQSRQRMNAAMQHKLNHSGQRLAHLAQVTDSLSPLGTLQRGYAILRDGQGKVIRDSSAVTTGDALEATLARGRLGLTVTRIDE